MGNKDDKDTVWCFDAKSGNVIWKHTYDEKLTPKLYDGGPNATPTIDDGRVYTLSKTGQLFCLDFATGKVKWQKHLKDDFDGKAPDWGYSAPPWVDGDHLIVLPCSKKDGALYVLDKKTGKTNWNTDNDARSGYTPARHHRTQGHPRRPRLPRPPRRLLRHREGQGQDPLRARLAHLLRRQRLQPAIP